MFLQSEQSTLLRKLSPRGLPAYQFAEYETPRGLLLVSLQGKLSPRGLPAYQFAEYETPRGLPACQSTGYENPS
uniref:Uncharacterized protein n=1 Tax=Fagus sylvatica TaxID=28930 RepID=A0A2N9FRH4_FAGSY